MSMSVGENSGSEIPKAEINVTPLADVMLVLLIMLIITIPVQLHAVNLNMPTGTPPPPTQEPVVVTIDIDFDGTVLWNGDAVNNEQLDQRLRSAAVESPQPEFHIRPNKLVTYKYVAHVMAAAQRDGVTKMGLIGAEQFLDQ